MFEREFAGKLAKNRFWVHRFQDNKNGQPCDVIAARNGKTYLFDQKGNPVKGLKKVQIGTTGEYTSYYFDASSRTSVKGKVTV